MNFFANIWAQICDFVKTYIAQPFVKIGVKDVIDILLLTVVLYGVYRFFRDRLWIGVGVNVEYFILLH